MKCFCQGEYGGKFIGTYHSKPICSVHVDKMSPRYRAQIQPLPADASKVAGKIRLLRACVPSGEFEHAQRLLDGDPEKAVEASYDAAVVGLIGVIRGWILQKIWTTDTLTAQVLTTAFLQPVETLRKSENPQTAFDAAFDLLDTISVQMEVVVEAAALVQYSVTLEERVKDLPLSGDVISGLNDQRLRLKGIIEEPSGRVPEDLQPIETELSQLDRQIQSIQDAKSQSIERERNNQGSKSGKKQRKMKRRAWDQDWESRLPRFDEENDEVPSNVTPIPASQPA
mgnify:CR=1 FL=1